MCLCHLIKQSWEDPGDYVYIAPTQRQAKRIAWRKLKKKYPDEIKSMDTWKNEVELWVENSRGGRVILLGADNPDSLRGEGWKGVIIDETADVDPYTYNTISPALSDFDGFLWFIGTPKGYDWFYEWFIKDKDFEDKTYRDLDDNPIEPDTDVKSFQFTTLANPHVNRSYVEKQRKKMSKEYFAQEFEASFSNFTGLIYREFMQGREKLILKAIRDKNDTVTGAKTEDGREIRFHSWYHWYAGLDTGRTSAWIQLAVDDKGNEYITDEVYDVDGLVRDIAQKIKVKIKFRSQRGGVIDSASQVKREYISCGITYMDSKKDVLTSIQTIRRKQKNKQLFVLDSCPAMIREFSSRRWNEKKKHGQPEPIKANDHACNALDYIQMTFLSGYQEPESRWSNRIKSPYAKKIETESIAAHTVRHESEKNILDNLA